MGIGEMEYGSMVFNDKVMKEVLPPDVYGSLRMVIEGCDQMDIGLANQVADAMKEWAISKGATHFTHWFQPLTGITAEKHDSFIEKAEGGDVIAVFSGKELIKGEPDASSFPSGGLRSTFEARGYTDWDPASYAFIKGKVLYIPTAFCSYSGEALDKKTPLLRSLDALSKQSVRVLRLFGNTEVKHVKANAGAEQEYFLVDKDLYDERPDLIFSGRTLFGNKPPKGQEMDDHYFGAIKPRVQAYMDELNEELWKLGILAKTEHNEVAPAQHELACIYEEAGIACDHNQLVMELMQTIALKHHFVCLLAEKPFAGVNGSGKHNNWSIETDTGVNLLSPGDTPYENAQFLLFLSAVIKAVDDYQDLLRFSVAFAGNDHRLGANEAPPAVISIFLGDELTAILEAIEKDKPYNAAEKKIMKLGVDSLPSFARDMTDRNRTSPFAYTGNKFEFRMPGSSQSIADANTMINSAVADTLRKFADTLEEASDFDAALHELIKTTITEHKRIIFNGNGYEDAWIKEAEKRGLLNLKTTPDSIPVLLYEKNKKMLTGLGIFSESELKSRYEICLENYIKTVCIEAESMLYMTRKLIMPAAAEYLDYIADTLVTKEKALVGLEMKYETMLLDKLSKDLGGMAELSEAIEKDLKLKDGLSELDCAMFVKNRLIPEMSELRSYADEAELYIPDSMMPYPDYSKLLFSER